MEEEKILDFIVSEYSWEQIIYKIIAWEGLDPWNLDIVALSEAFLEYIKKLKQMDFKIPAKYVIIASTLLRMKSDHLRYLGDFNEVCLDEECTEDMESIDTIEEDVREEHTGLEINPISVPPKRQPRRKIVVDELIKALRLALKTRERRALRKERVKKKISIRNENITERINILYQKINSILSRLKKKEIEFSSVVEKWERNEIVNTFLPLIFLDHQKKVECRQEEIFKEIFIRRRAQEN